MLFFIRLFFLNKKLKQIVFFNGHITSQGYSTAFCCSFSNQALFIAMFPTSTYLASQMSL